MFIIRKLLLWKATTWQPTTNRPFHNIPLTFLNSCLGNALCEPYFCIIFSAQFMSVCQEFANSVVLHSFWVKCSLVPLSFFNMSRSLSTREVSLGFSIEALEFVAAYFAFYLLLSSSLFDVKSSTYLFHLILSCPCHTCILYKKSKTFENKEVNLLLLRYLTSAIFSATLTSGYMTFTLAQPFISPTSIVQHRTAITINGPMLDSSECKSFVSAVTLWSEKKNRRKLPAKVSKVTGSTASAVQFSVCWLSLSDRCL